MASINGMMEVARLLVERGADVDAEDNEGKTAYHIALDRGFDDEIAQFLSRDSVENKT